MSTEQEIIIKYASLVAKADATEVAKDVGKGAAEVVAGEAAIKTAPKALAWASGALTGGLEGLAAVLSSPAVLFGLGGAALVGAMYYWYKNTHFKDAIDELIHDMETLDPNDAIKPTLDKWIDQLKGYSTALNMPAMEADPAQNGANWHKTLVYLGEVDKFLKNILTQWNTLIKPNLTDIGTDPQDAKNSLNKAIVAVDDAIKLGEEKLKETVNTAIKEQGERKHTDYSKLAQDLLNNYALAQQEGIISLDNNEQKTIELAQSIVQGNPDEDLTKAFLGNLEKLNNEFLKYTKQVQDFHTKKSSTKKYLSKRALSITTSDGQVFGNQKEDSQKTTPAGLTTPKSSINPNPEIAKLQTSLNTIISNPKYPLNVAKLNVDGIYGKHTLEALSTLKGVGNLGEYIDRVGATDEVLSNNQAMQNAKFLPALNYILNAIVEDISNNNKNEQKSSTDNKNQTKTENKNQLSNRENQKPLPQKATDCDSDKENPTSTEILACLMAKDAYDPATKERYNLYDLGVRLGYSNDQMVRYIIDAFNGASSREWDPAKILRDWQGNGTHSLY